MTMSATSLPNETAICLLLIVRRPKAGVCEAFPQEA